MSTTSAVRPFDATGWLKWSEDEAAERIAPYYPAYLARRSELDTVGLYPYNDRFRATIDGTGSDDEGTLIYLLQGWHRLQGERAQLAAFIARGAYKITPADVKPGMRGRVANVGRYSGAFRTGYEEFHDVRLVTVYNGTSLGYIPLRKRNAYALDGREIYFLPNQKEQNA